MTIDQVLELVKLCLTLAFAGVLHMCWRSYKVDVLRNELFALRDELFSFAADGRISFDHPAYGSLRQTLNSIIRYTHRLSMLRFVLAAAIVVKRDGWAKTDAGRHLQHIGEITDDEVRQYMITVHARMLGICVHHMLTATVLLAPIWFGFLLLLRAKSQSSKPENVSASFPRADTIEIQAREAEDLMDLEPQLAVR